MQIKIYLSSFDYEVLKEYRGRKPKAEINVLLSYGTTNNKYYKMIVEEKERLINSLILDSGAFTLNFAGQGTGSKINLNGFIQYCRTFKDQFKFIFNFDSNFNLNGFGENLANQKELENAGIKVVPVVHDYIGKQSPELDYYLNHYELISLGYSKHKDNKKILTDTVYKIKNAGKKVHLLGVSAYDRICDLPIDFNDSSNWAQAQKFGFMYYWNAQNDPKKPEVTLRFRDYEPDREDDSKIFFEDFEYRENVEQYLKNELGIRYRDLYGQNSTFMRQLVNTHYYVQLQDRVREAHAKLGFDTTYP